MCHCNIYIYIKNSRRQTRNTFLINFIIKKEQRSMLATEEEMELKRVCESV